jgi:hypothetical protein
MLINTRKLYWQRTLTQSSASDCTDNDFRSPMLPDEFESVYGFEPDGMNFYLGIRLENTDPFELGGDVFQPHQASFFEAMRRFARGQRKMIMLGLEPPKHGPEKAFDFVLDHLGYVRAVADQLRQVQEAVEDGGQLDIVVRFASEMNDRPSTNFWGQQSEGFIAAYTQVRQAFRDNAPQIRFAFSPAIRGDLQRAFIKSRQPNISDATLELFNTRRYLPDDNDIDLITCTYYAPAASKQKEHQASLQYFGDYCRAFDAERNHPVFAIDEIGCGKGISDLAVRRATLQAMLDVIAELESDGISFQYAGFFLECEHDQDHDQFESLFS